MIHELKRQAEGHTSRHNNAKGIAFVALAGENEMAAGKLTLKNMKTGEQKLVSIDELIREVK